MKAPLTCGLKVKSKLTVIIIAILESYSQNMFFLDPRGIITEDVLIEYLQRYGDLKALRAVGPSRWFVEWYDDRRADAAQKQLVARDFAVSPFLLHGLSC
jgi:hypothetical protein